jgi:hypothetical protein
MLIIIIGCLGGITFGIGAIQSVLQISLVVFPTMMAPRINFSIIANETDHECMFIGSYYRYYSAYSKLIYLKV